MKILVQMDDIFKINVKTDSTYRIMLFGQELGYEIYYYTPDQLSFDSCAQDLRAFISKVKLTNDPVNYCQIIEQKYDSLKNYQVILVRQDPPFDMNYITSTYLLEKISDKVLVLNDPLQIRNSPEKIFVTEFANLTPPTLISSDKIALKQFQQLHKKIIVKPLYSCGGEGVVYLEEDSVNFNSIIELLISKYQAPIVAQQFIADVKFGDKRIILIDGEYAGGIVRMPQNNEIRSNLHIGGVAQVLKASSRDLEICQSLKDSLQKRNLFFVGIDIIGDYLTEINVTSPTCIPEINQLANCSIEKIFFDKLALKIKNR
ncbi:MAG: glutathione synthase [Alphaproteobacteria bacterium]